MIDRQSFDEIPPKVKYSLSEKGRSIIPIFEMISKWSEKYYVDDDSNSDCEQLSCYKLDFIR